MSEFYLDTKVNITPIEELTLEDGVTKKKVLNSIVDNIFGSSIISNIGSDYNDLLTKEKYQLGNTVPLTTIFSSLNSTDTISFIYVKLRDDTPDNSHFLMKITNVSIVSMSSKNEYLVLPAGVTASEFILYGTNSPLIDIVLIKTII